MDIIVDALDVTIGISAGERILERSAIHAVKSDWRLNSMSVVSSLSVLNVRGSMPGIIMRR